MAKLQSIHEVKNKSRIVAIMEISEARRYNYTFMRQIVVKRQDEQKYKFAEADFPRLELNDIEDMYPEKVRGNLRRYEKDTQYNFISSLLMYIRRLIVQEEWKTFSLELKVTKSCST